ncbi:MAG: shikimate kinase, partial [Gemmatimonadota bacterium]|nr:shikimate kinase [Gemmatimonadota bacterium]
MPWVSVIGFMCCGKSASGRSLARQLGWPHYDTDSMIVERTGLEVAEIFASMGEEAFRRMESEVVEELAPERDAVVSTGGGFVLNEIAMEILRVQGPIFWLRVEPEDVAERARRPWAPRRPMLEGPDLEDRVAQLMRQREPLYRKYGISVPGGFDHPRNAARH